LRINKSRNKKLDKKLKKRKPPKELHRLKNKKNVLPNKEPRTSQKRKQRLRLKLND